MLDELPEFALEGYLGEWGFAARHHLTASDAQTLTIGELLALAGPEQRAELERLSLSYTPTWGRRRCLKRSRTPTKRSGPSTC